MRTHTPPETIVREDGRVVHPSEHYRIAETVCGQHLRSGWGEQP